MTYHIHNTRIKTERVLKSSVLKQFLKNNYLKFIIIILSLSMTDIDYIFVHMDMTDIPSAHNNFAKIYLHMV